MNTLKLTVTALVLCVFFSTATYSQIASKEVDVLVENAMKKFEVAGLAVAIVKDGKIIYKKGFGIRSIETKEPVNEFTNFQIASNSKAFTTAALSILEEEGKLKWEDKGKKYIPEFKIKTQILKKL
ncbi:serine hydrolase domain-containing protein [Flavobacterium sp. LS2P90]|uniref:Serine hydrolase domain-containing protein n=1 Tax=Flavobacterium xylosi TaxID=3230415 RepID=A0ABW6HXK9_9FLAO